MVDRPKGKNGPGMLRSRFFIGYGYFPLAGAGQCSAIPVQHTFALWALLPLQQDFAPLAEHCASFMPWQQFIAEVLASAFLPQQDISFASLPSQQEAFASPAVLPWQQPLDCESGFAAAVGVDVSLAAQQQSCFVEALSEGDEAVGDCDFCAGSAGAADCCA
jgi:hypothetical protein